MGLINKMTDKIRTRLRTFLDINPAPHYTISINENVDHLADCAKNRIWYAGKSKQLSELYAQLDVPRTVFWKAVPTRGQEIRKIHTGLPKLIVKTLTNIVIADYNGIEIDDRNGSANRERWEQICSQNNNFALTLKNAIRDLCVVGDGAFKISYDKAVSDVPLIEWYPAERVDFTRVRGQIREVAFYTDYISNHSKYYFVEVYGYGFIRYELYDENKHRIPLSSIPQTSWIKEEGVLFDDSYMWAVPVLYDESDLYKGRGEGLLDAKEDAFDSLDEVWSQWMDALRAGRTKTRIPENMIPRDPDTGMPVPPNPFDDRYIAIGNDMSESGNGNKIYTDTPTIQDSAYLSSYVTALDLCLQGIISPSTLGIDTKKLDNAEAQREKEKTTLYTRQNFVELIENTLPKLVNVVLNADSELHGTGIIGNIDCVVKFGEYANPSFESQIETIAKARQGGVMSVEAAVDELYGDSKTEDWKEKEVTRLKDEQGITEESEPGVNIDVLELGNEVQED